MNQVPARSGRPAIQQGLIFGIIVGIVFTINTLIGDFTNIGASAGIISILLFLVELVLYAAAGFRASAQTGRVGPGTLAGVFTGLIGGIIGFIVTIIVAFSATSLLQQRSQAAADALHINVHYTNSIIISAAFIGAIIGLAIAVGLGAGFGAIGGVIGKSRAPRAQVSYQEQFYQGMPPAPMNPVGPYNQGYPQNGQGYSQNNQENPYQYNQPPQPNSANPSNPYNQGDPPPSPSSNA